MQPGPSAWANYLPREANEEEGSIYTYIHYGTQASCSKQASKQAIFKSPWAPVLDPNLQHVGGPMDKCVGRMSVSIYTYIHTKPQAGIMQIKNMIWGRMAYAAGPQRLGKLFAA